MKFGQLDETSFKSKSLQPLADLVAKNENVSIVYVSLSMRRVTGTSSAPSLSKSFAWIRQSS